MQVFKFGGASVRNSDGVRNLKMILGRFSADPLLVVVSAMGKTTNLLEELLQVSKNQAELEKKKEEFLSYHESIIRRLLPDGDFLVSEIKKSLKIIDEVLKSDIKATAKYDSIVSQGEIASTKIISEYLKSEGLNVHWADARELIITDDHFMEGHVDWTETCQMIQGIKNELSSKIIVTQGFIGGTTDGETTTLGREGSDYSAAIFATCLKASSVTVWKDVNGIMNGDPKRIDNTVKYDELPYTEAAEMTYYGASVIHPKTIKPLANAHIPLFVKSFFNPDENGTVIHDCNIKTLVPAVIIKDNQCLVSFHVRDFTFINERNIRLLYHELSEADLNVNLMQNSAISVSVILDYHPEHLSHLIDRLSDHFGIRYNTSLELLTIKNYTPDYIERFRQGREILLEQISRKNYRAVMNPASGHVGQRASPEDFL